MDIKNIVIKLEQNGFVFQGSAIYGGLSNTWDYGPLGVELKNNIKKAWWKKFIHEDKNCVGLDASILMNRKVWEASGHIGGFSDPLMDCTDCKKRFRADKLIEDFSKGKEIADGWSNEKMETYIEENNIQCPECKANSFTKIRQFNLMFKTQQGVIDSETNTVFLRPETAQAIFVNFKNILRSTRSKLPIGVGQIGKSFRNEITPGNFIFRTREFEQMELEFFTKPNEADKWYKYYNKFCLDFLLNLGVNKENLKIRKHSSDELAHYAAATTDIEYKFPFGWGELWGIANRKDYDLKQHQTHSKQNLEYIDQDENIKYLPYVIEPSVGCDRLLLALVCDSFVLEKNGDETREIMKLHPFISPYKVAVLPLIKKIHSAMAHEIYAKLSVVFNITIDESGKIGKRYRRQDIIGTPFCITIEDRTISESIVTVRNRDTMAQEEVQVNDLINYISAKITL